jgi:hypothetical protein
MIKRENKMPQFYRTFKCSATNWDQFAHNRKITQSTGLTFAQAKAECEAYNKNRTARQIRKGTMIEFERI